MKETDFADDPEINRILGMTDAELMADMGTRDWQDVEDIKKLTRRMIEAFDAGKNAALEEAAKKFEKMHSEGPLGEFNGKWVASQLRGMK